MCHNDLLICRKKNNKNVTDIGKIVLSKLVFNNEKFSRKEKKTLLNKLKVTLMNNIDTSYNGICLNY